MLNRKITELGIYLVDRSTPSRILDPQYVGERHYAAATTTQRILQRYKELRTSSPFGMDELSEDDKKIVGRARRLQRFMAAVRGGRAVPGIAGKYVRNDLQLRAHLRR